jgi:hypothetical protein
MAVEAAVKARSRVRGGGRCMVGREVSIRVCSYDWNKREVLDVKMPVERWKIRRRGVLHLINPWIETFQDYFYLVPEIERQVWPLCFSILSDLNSEIPSD